MAIVWSTFPIKPSERTINALSSSPQKALKTFNRPGRPILAPNLSKTILDYRTGKRANMNILVHAPQSFKGWKFQSLFPHPHPQPHPWGPRYGGLADHRKSFDGNNLT